MAKVKQPLYSFAARGMLDNTLVFRDYVSSSNRSSRVNIKGFSKKPTGEKQKIKEKGVEKCQRVWADLSHSEKQSWENIAFGNDDGKGQRSWNADLAAYHKFMSFAMRAYLRGDPIPRTLIES